MPQDRPEFVEVYTRYGGRHLARKIRPHVATYDPLGRHFSLCGGTSSWTLKSWELAEEGHPQGDAFLGEDNPMCLQCERIAGSYELRPLSAVRSEEMKRDLGRMVGEPL